LFISKLSFDMIHNIEYNEKWETYSSSSTNVIAKTNGAFSKVVASCCIIRIANEILLELQIRIYISCVLHPVNVYFNMVCYTC